MSPRVYVRAFDWDEARRRVAAGETMTSVARDFGVSTSAIYRVIDTERYKADRRRVKEWGLSGKCPDCGAQTTRLSKTTSARCIRCAAKLKTTSAREGELECTTCRRWLPDEEFPFSRALTARRQRHRQCRSCLTLAKRDYRARNPGRG